MLRLWNTVSTNIGSDLSWGIGARIAQVGMVGGMKGLFQDSGLGNPLFRMLWQEDKAYASPPPFVSSLRPWASVASWWRTGSPSSSTSLLKPTGTHRAQHWTRND